MKRRMNAPRSERRGAALLIVLILIAVLTGGTLAMVNIASTDVDIAAAGRQEVITFAVAESALDEVLTDGRTKIEADPLAPGAGFSPNPDHPTLSAQYPNVNVPIVTPGSGGQATAFVRYVRFGPVQESST
jgi:Tfp pilus assembly protein PilX